MSALSERQCRDLLQSSNLARVAWQTADGPEILPVNYACHGDVLVFRTSPEGPLSELIRPTEVAVEVDELDQQRRSGWSVVVHGRAASVEGAAEIAQLQTISGLLPWAPGVREVFIQITPRRVSGRLLSHDRDGDEPREPSGRR